jgi:hypothetical protein
LSQEDEELGRLMPGNLLQIVESTTLSAAEITDITKQIHAFIPSQSKWIRNAWPMDQPNNVSQGWLPLRKLPIGWPHF